MPTHKKRDEDYDVEAASNRTDEGDVEQVDSAGKGFKVNKDGEKYVSPREGTSGTDVGYLTLPR